MIKMNVRDLNITRSILSALALTVLNLFVLHSANASPIYVFKEADGSIRFTNKTPPPGVNARVFTATRPNFSYYRTGLSRSVRNNRLFSSLYSDIIQSAADENRLDPHLIRAVIHVESAFNSSAISRKGARGLMQLMPGTARDLGVRNPFQPHENIRGGARHLARLVVKYGGNLKLALAAYNAGEEAVQRYRGVPPYSETQQYVRKVLELKERYSSSTYG